MTGQVGETIRAIEADRMMSSIRSADNYKDISSIIDRVQKIIDEILTQTPEHIDFDGALLLQFPFLNLLKDKGWIAESQYRATFSFVLDIARTRFPSGDSQDREDYILYLDAKSKQLTELKWFHPQ